MSIEEKHLVNVLKRCICCNQENIADFFCRDIYNVQKCDDCGAQFVNPRFFEDSINSVYPDDYWSNESSNIAKAAITNELGMSQRAQGDIALLSKYFSKKISYLDVGFGTAHALEAARKLGWDGCGIDPSIEAVEFAKKKGIENVILGCFEEKLFSDQKFDLITAFDCFEHIVDPNKFLIDCKNVLNDNGLIAIAVPNVASVSARINQKRWSQYIFPDHLNFYSSSTLKIIANRNNLIVEDEFSFPSISLGVRELLKKLQSNYNIKVLSYLINSITSFKKYIFYPPANYLCKKFNIESNLLFVILKKEK